VEIRYKQNTGEMKFGETREINGNRERYRKEMVNGKKW